MFAMNVKESVSSVGAFINSSNRISLSYVSRMMQQLNKDRVISSIKSNVTEEMLNAYMKLREKLSNNSMIRLVVL